MKKKVQLQHRTHKLSFKNKKNADSAKNPWNDKISVLNKRTNVRVVEKKKEFKRDNLCVKKLSLRSAVVNLFFMFNPFLVDY